MAGVDDAQAAEVGLDDRVDERRHVVRAQRLVVEVQARDDLGGRVALDGVRAGDAAQLAHARGGVDAAPGDVADDQPEAPAGQGEGVEPVAADRCCASPPAEKCMASVAPGASGSRRGQQVALQRRGDRALALVGGLGLGARGLLGDQALAGGLGAAALAQVVDLDEHGEDPPVGLAHAPGEHGDREAPRRRPGAARRRAAPVSPRARRRAACGGRAVLGLDQRGQLAPTIGPAAGEPHERRVGARTTSVGVDEAAPVGSERPRQQEQLVGAGTRAAVALELAEDRDLGAQDRGSKGLRT